MLKCEHLAELERELLAAGIPTKFRGRPWSSRCREWVYFACRLDRASIRARLPLAECVHDHDHLGTHDGCESGLVCSACDDAILGAHERDGGEYPTFA